MVADIKLEDGVYPGGVRSENVENRNFLLNVVMYKENRCYVIEEKS